MALLTVAELRELVESDLSDTGLGILLDAADYEIIARLGALASQVDVLPGGDHLLHLPRRAASISSVVERYLVEGVGLQDTTLVASDFELLSDGYRVERKTTGTNSNWVWRGRVTITTVPYDQTGETARRKALLVDLVKLANRYEGVGEQSVGDVRVRHMADQQAERDRLFSALATTGRRLLT